MCILAVHLASLAETLPKPIRFSTAMSRRNTSLLRQAFHLYGQTLGVEK